MIPIAKKLLKIEEEARRFFERFPFAQAAIAGVGVIIFWRGIWELLDRSGVTPFTSVILGALLLGSVGVFIQTFIGNTIIIKEVKQEEKMEKKAIENIDGDPVTLRVLSAKIDALAEKLAERDRA